MTSTPPLRFDGQVAIVTGAGGGLGRCFALALAQRGAQVLVNDYGGDTAGHSGSASMAEKVADEITAAGGRAAANATPVGTTESARAIVDAALKAFGRIDILINNAGISLPGRFDKADDDALENLFRINLLGPYALMRAVWPTMKQQAGGRILNISSNAALGVGHNAPYATTKAGLLGLTLDCAAAGKAFGILANALMPAAYTRMTDMIPDPARVAWFKDHLPAEKVAAAALYFVSRASGITGHIYSTGGGRLARVAFAEGRGILDPAIAPETVRDRLAEIVSMDEPTLLFSHSDEMRLFSEAFPP